MSNTLLGTRPTPFVVRYSEDELRCPMATIVKCPICHTQVVFEDNPFRPFCSERCKLIDLGAWAGEKYRIPEEATDKDATEENDEDDDEPNGTN